MMPITLVTWMRKIPSQSIWESEKDREVLIPEVGFFRDDREEKKVLT